MYVVCVCYFVCLCVASRGFGDVDQKDGEVTQVEDADGGGGTVQSPCLNLQTDPAWPVLGTS